MRLENWLKENGINASEFAATIGVHRSTVGRWCDSENRRRPEWEQIARITSATDGAVTANDFMDDEGEGPEKPAANDDGPAGLKAAGF